MELIHPRVDLWKPWEGHINHVARCARVCYASTADSELSNKKLYDSLVNRGHTSMLRHESRYYLIKQSEIGKDVYRQIYQELRNYKYCPYIEYSCVDSIIYIAINGDFYRNQKYEKLINLINDFEIPFIAFEQYIEGWHMMRLTFCVVTQISTSRELNRTSPNNIAEQSTRYVNFGKKGGITICLPHWWRNASWFKKFIHKTYWKSSEIMYKFLLKLGFKPEDARGVLPLDTATKVVYTYSVKEWKNILDLRYFEKTGKAHPNAKIIGEKICSELISDHRDYENLV